MIIQIQENIFGHFIDWRKVMFQNYNRKKTSVLKMSVKFQNALEKEIEHLSDDIDNGLFDFLVPLDSDVQERINLINEDDTNLFFVVKRIFDVNVFKYKCIIDEQNCEHYDFVTFRNTGEKVDIGFSYYAPLNRLEMMILLEFQKKRASVWYEQYYLINKKDMLYSFIRNSLIIFERVDEIISKYHSVK